MSNSRAGELYSDPDWHRSSHSHCVSGCGDENDAEDDVNNSSPTTPLLLSDVPHLTSSTTSLITHSMLTATTPLTYNTLSSLAKVCLSSSLFPSLYRPSGGSSTKRHSSSTLSVSTWCASLGFCCIVAVAVLLVTACIYGLFGSLRFGPLSSSSLLLVRPQLQLRQRGVSCRHGWPALSRVRPRRPCAQVAALVTH